MAWVAIDFGNRSRAGSLTQFRPVLLLNANCFRVNYRNDLGVTVSTSDHS